MNVTVIVTTYNRPFALKKVLNGLAYQVVNAQEIIIADDGSGKETAQVIKEFSRTMPFRVLHIWQEHKGFRAARIRNKAIKASSGDYIIILDGDCIPNRYFIKDHISLAERGYFIQGKRVLIKRQLERQFNHIHANSFGFLCSASLKRHISNSHHILRFPLFPTFKNKRLRGIKGCNMSFFKDDILAVNGFNEDFEGWGREDSELAVRFYNYGLKRKEHTFMAICYHLWHPKPSRDSLKRNDELLRHAINSKAYFCSNGIVKK